MAKRAYEELVSILVLMEVGLRVNRWQTSISKHTSFNPCFNGSWSERVIERLFINW